jgi:hypothetical protein
MGRYSEIGLCEAMHRKFDTNQSPTIQSYFFSITSGDREPCLKLGGTVTFAPKSLSDVAMSVTGGIWGWS